MTPILNIIYVTVKKNILLGQRGKVQRSGAVGRLAAVRGVTIVEKSAFLSDLTSLFLLDLSVPKINVDTKAFEVYFVYTYSMEC